MAQRERFGAGHYEKKIKKKEYLKVHLRRGNAVQVGDIFLQGCGVQVRKSTVQNIVYQYKNTTVFNGSITNTLTSPPSGTILDPWVLLDIYFKQFFYHHGSDQ